MKYEKLDIWHKLTDPSPDLAIGGYAHEIVDEKVVAAIYLKLIHIRVDR